MNTDFISRMTGVYRDQVAYQCNLIFICTWYFLVTIKQKNLKANSVDQDQKGWMYLLISGYCLLIIGDIGQGRYRRGSVENQPDCSLLLLV